MVRWFRGLNDEILALYPRIDNTPLCLPSVAGQAPSKRGESIRALFLPINYSTVFALYFAPSRLNIFFCRLVLSVRICFIRPIRVPFFKNLLRLNSSALFSDRLVSQRTWSPAE